MFFFLVVGKGGGVYVKCAEERRYCDLSFVRSVRAELRSGMLRMPVCIIPCDSHTRSWLEECSGVQFEAAAEMWWQK
jgi:hypothetical protein